MPWFKNPFKKEAVPSESAAPVASGGMPQLPPELADDPKLKGMMGTFFR
mgnify:CR=1 FL=1